MNNRDMYYSNYNAGGFVEPQMYPNMMGQPQGFTQTQQYQAFGPNVVPNQNNNYQNQNYYLENDYETRLTKLERQVRALQTKLSKLESSIVIEENITTDTYML